MRSLNRVELIGHVGADPEIHTTKGGTRVAKMSVATNRRSGTEEATDWHRIALWDKLAGVAERFIKKGDPVWVEGELRYSVSGEGAARRFRAEIVGRRVILLGSRRGDS